MSLSQSVQLYQLKSILKRQDLVSALFRAAEGCGEALAHDGHDTPIQRLVMSAQAKFPQHKSDMTSFKAFIHWFFTDLAFSGAKEQYFQSKYSLISRVVASRTGIPAVLAVIFCHIAQRIGFDVGCVGFPGQFLIRWQAYPGRAYFIDPSCGRFLTYAQLLAIYQRGHSAEDIPQELFEVVDDEVTLIRVLHNLKAAYINEQDYTSALLVCDMLVELLPDDPYSRRDRALLLDQLDCKHSALNDYQYFVDHCPDDPMIQLVQTQLNQAKKQVCVVH